MCGGNGLAARTFGAPPASSRDAIAALTVAKAGVNAKKARRAVAAGPVRVRGLS